MKKRNFFQHAQIRSSEGRRFKNPYFKRTKSLPWLKILLVALVLIGLISAIGAVIYGPWLTITKTQIDGLTTIPVDEMNSTVWAKINEPKWRLIPANHRWFFNEKKMVAYLNSKYNFDSAEIKIEGDTLHLTAAEKISALVWRKDRDFYFLDLNGVINRQLTEPEKNSIFKRLKMQFDVPEDQLEFAPLQPTVPIIEDKGRAEVKIEQALLSEGMTNGIAEFDKLVRRQGVEPIIYEIDSSKEVWLRTKTVQGFDVLFDGAGDIKAQVTALAVALDEYKDRLNEIQYIDVRFQGRAFVK